MNLRIFTCSQQDEKHSTRPLKMPEQKTARMAQEKQSSASAAALNEYNSQCQQHRHLGDVGSDGDEEQDGVY